MSTPYKLFTDGNSFPRAKRSGFGGYIENSQGEIIVEFTEQVRTPQYFHSFEILGVIRGLKIALEYGVKDIISYCDDKNTTQRLIEIFDKNTFAVSEAQKPELYEKVIEIAQQFDSISFKYIPRELNKKADNLSRQYAQSMEDIWLQQFSHDLNTSVTNLERNKQPKRRAFFAHSALLPLLHKGNPYLVAQQRSKMVRKVLRAEDKTGFNYLFIEYFNNNNVLELEARLYNDQEKCVATLAKTSFPYEKEMSETETVDAFHNTLIDSLNVVKQQYPEMKKLWINSNNDHIMSYTEQCEKIPTKNWDTFRTLFLTVDGFDKIVFHHLPFDVRLTMCPEKQLRKNISDDEKWEQMLGEYHSIDNIRDKRRKFGQLICHTLKLMKKEGQELNDDTVKSVIKKIEKSIR